MTYPTGIGQGIEDVGNLPEILEAAYEAFEAMLSVIDGYNDGRGPFHAGLVMAAAAAADGRDAILAAPSLPPPSGDAVGAAGLRADACSRGVDQAADDRIYAAAATVAALSASIASGLRRATAKAATAVDRAACLDAARCADEVLVLTRGNGT